MNFGPEWIQATWAPGGPERKILESGFEIHYYDPDDGHMAEARIVGASADPMTVIQGYGTTRRDALAMAWGHYMFAGMGTGGGGEYAPEPYFEVSPEKPRYGRFTA